MNELSALQSAFLSQALYDVSFGLSRSSDQLARSLLHCVQAEILLSQYFFINGRSLEGNYHISNAVSMVFGAGFHKIRSADMYSFEGRAGMQSLPPPIDPVEEGERANALWQVVVMNSCWTGVDGSPSNIAYDVLDSRIDTPWPLDAEDYSQVNIKSICCNFTEFYHRCNSKMHREYIPFRISYPIRQIREDPCLPSMPKLPSFLKKPH